MADWFGWMSGSCFYDIFTCSRLDHPFGCHFSGEVFNYNQISHQRFLFQQEKGTFDNFGLLDLLTHLQRGTTGRMVEIRLEGTDVTCSVQWESSLPSDQAYSGVAIFTSYFLPLAVITFCYYKIHQVSRQIVVNTSHFDSLAMTMTQALLKKHRKSAFYFLAVIAGFLIPWSPYAVVSSLLVLGRKVHPVTTSACIVFARISFFLNPIPYAIFHGRFRRRLILSVPLTKPNRVVKPAGLPSVSRTLAL